MKYCACTIADMESAQFQAKYMGPAWQDLPTMTEGLGSWTSYILQLQHNILTGVQQPITAHGW